VGSQSSKTSAFTYAINLAPDDDLRKNQSPDYCPNLTHRYSLLMINEHDSAFPEEQLNTSKKKISGKFIGIVVGGITFLIAGIAVSFALLSGGGNQPEDVLPRDTVAIAKIDLNPKIGQRINLVRFLTKFPKTIKNFNEEDPIGSLLEQSSITSDLDWAEIKPWIGNRYAVAFVESSGDLHPVLVFAIKNPSEMKYFFNKNYPELNTAVVLDYLLIADDKSVLNVITSAPSHLADNEDYKSDMKTLGGDQIASVWVNVKPITKLAENYIADFFYNEGLEQNLDAVRNIKGRLAVGMHFTSDTFVTDLITVDLSQDGVKVEDQSKSLEIIGDLPAELLGVLSIDGIGKAINDSLLKNSLVEEFLNNAGISANDAKSLLDGPIALMVVDDNRINSEPTFVIRMEPANPAQTLIALQKVLSRNGFYQSDLDSIIAAEGKYIYLGADSESLQHGIAALKSGNAHLREDSQFKKTLTESGNLSLYVDLNRLLPKFDIDISGAPVGGLGITIGADPKHPGVSRTKITFSLKSN